MSMSGGDFRRWAKLRAKKGARAPRRRPESIYPHDHFLARRVAEEQELEKVVNDQAKAALRRR